LKILRGEIPMLMQGKKVLILGVANEMSIAWGIAKSAKAQGARIALSYLNEQLQKRVEPLAQEIEADFTFELDVTQDAHYEAMSKIIQEKWGEVDVVIHSLAFADKEDLKKTFSETSREGYKMAHDISAFSLVAVTNALRDQLASDASIIAMTYHGASQVLKGYNVMGCAKASLECAARYLADDLGPRGVRVNCISAGPIRTLAASGVPGLKTFLKTIEEKAPLRRNITTEDVGGAAVFLGSSLSRGVTGQVLYVDSGISIIAS
jgi:enoyl-[acyl-carrier protein] reductase I